MSEDKILIPRKEMLEAEEFYDNFLYQALRKCQEKGLEAVFMPSIIDARIESPNNARIWGTWYSTPSIMATGRTQQGNPVVVYAHIPNYFSNPDNIEEAIRKGLVGGAGIMPEKEFQRLLDLEDNENVFVVDYETLKESGSDVISLEEALDHPQTIPFLGRQERAERYLERHGEVYGGGIGIWHTDDLADRPLGRLLFLGGSCGDCLDGDCNLDDDGRFVGVSAEGAEQKNYVPTQEQLTRIIGEYVAPRNMGEVKQRIAALYK